MASDIAARSPHAIRAAKRLLDLAGRMDLATGFAAEQKEIRALIGSPNQVEAVRPVRQAPARLRRPGLTPTHPKPLPGATPNPYRR